MRESIQDMYSKIKSLLQNDTLFYTLIIIAVAIASFGLGRLSIEQNIEKESILGIQTLPLSSASLLMTEVATSTSLNKPNKNNGITNQQSQSVTEIIASKNGTKYHYSWCPGAKQIKEANKIIFSTPAAARTAGYTPASNCPDLE